MAGTKGFAFINRQKSNFACKRDERITNNFTSSTERFHLPSPLRTLVALPIYCSVALCHS